MLEEHYSSHFHELARSLDWDIELPVEWADYFEDRGEIASLENDERHNQRLKVRTHGILWFDRSLHFYPRTKDPVGVYTRDFSKNGMGFLAPLQIFPEEQVRILLPTFWLQLNVIRTRRITSKCYEVGASLIWRHDPSDDAFVVLPSAATIDGE